MTGASGVPPGYRIRLAIPRDVPALPDVERAAARLYLPWADRLRLTPDMLEKTSTNSDFVLAQETGMLWVAATPDDEPVGFALLREIDGAIHLDELDVHPLHGRRGLGTALLRRVCDEARAAGCDVVTLSTYRDVPWNAPYYAKHGFRILREDELGAGLVRLREGEQQRGHRLELRVVMRRDVRGTRATGSP